MLTGIKKVRWIAGFMDIFSLHEKYMKAIDSWDGLSLWLLTRSISEREYSDLYNMFPKNKKTKYKMLCNALESVGLDRAKEVADDLDLMVCIEDDCGINEIMEVEHIKEVFIYCKNETIYYIEGMEK